GELSGLRDEIPYRHGDPLGKRAWMPLREDRPRRVERLVASPIGMADDRMHDDLVAVGIGPRRVAAENHRQLLVAQPDTAERPEIVMVERRCAHRNGCPAVTGLRLRLLADLESGNRVVRVEPGRVDREHGAMLVRYDGLAARSSSSCLSSERRILPVRVFGSSATNSTRRGYAYADRRPRTNVFSSSASSSAGS